jgi:hypothetical protein
MKIKKSKWTLYMVSFVMLGLAYSFTACSKDDSKKEPALTDAYGDYAGKMTVTLTPQGEGVDIAATVQNDTVSFAKFPVDGIIMAIIPVAEQAAAIIQEVGDVKYAVGYKAEFNAAKDNIVLNLSPKPLELTFPMMVEGGAIVNMAVKVDISAEGNGNYVIDSKNLKFSLKVNSVTVNDAPYPSLPSMSFGFDLNKK